MFKKDDVIEKLKINIVNIKFIKRDGSTRNMKATLREDIYHKLQQLLHFHRKKLEIFQKKFNQFGIQM